MSYCRFSEDCDVYMFFHVDGFICCSACAFDDPWIVELKSLGDALEHVHKHRVAGHQMPDDLEAAIGEDHPWSHVN